MEAVNTARKIRSSHAAYVLVESGTCPGWKAEVSDKVVLSFITSLSSLLGIPLCRAPSRQVACVPLATLMAYEVYYGLAEEEGAVPMEHQVGEVGERPSL